ncbi:MAG: dipeptidase [Ignavibacterium sp.]|nr:dipeptidase [Ignavibacterium sp.]
MKKLLLLIILTKISFSQEDINLELYQKAIDLSKEILIIDTHIDLPNWIFNENFDANLISQEDQFDFVRAKQGGLNIAFLSIFTSVTQASLGKSKERADFLINTVKNNLSKFPDKFKIITSFNEIDTTNKEILYVVLGMENGSPIEDKIENLIHYHKEGIKYITLTHYKSNLIGDSANDSIKVWNGLSEFGKNLIKEMNRYGIMIDVSHISDSTFFDIIEITSAPIIASHSACRYFTPGFERNLSDDIIKEIAKKRGVVQIPFADFFLREDANKKFIQNEIEVEKFIKENYLGHNSRAAEEFELNYWKENPLPKSSVIDVANHIDHIVKLVGVDYVGIGSDFNGVRTEFITSGLEDCSKYPNLIYELLRRNYSVEDIKKIMGLNFLRVWKEVEEIANGLK